MVISGACPTRANRFRTSPMRRGAGSVRPSLGQEVLEDAADEGAGLGGHVEAVEQLPLGKGAVVVAAEEGEHQALHFLALVGKGQRPPSSG
jgi:hypothetical protein